MTLFLILLWLWRYIVLVTLLMSLSLTLVWPCYFIMTLTLFHIIGVGSMNDQSYLSRWFINHDVFKILPCIWPISLTVQMTYIFDLVDHFDLQQDLNPWPWRWTLEMTYILDLSPWPCRTYILDLAVKLPADYSLYYSCINDAYILWNVAEDLAISSLLRQFFLPVVFQPIVAWFLKVEGVLFEIIKILIREGREGEA